VDEPDGLDLTERPVTSPGMAQILEVDEADLLEWIESRELEVRRGDDGEPRLPIREPRDVPGAGTTTRRRRSTDMAGRLSSARG
jgi:hypothetical protein